MPKAKVNQTLTKLQLSNANVLQILNAKNVELSGTGLSLWQTNHDVKFSFIATVHESRAGNKWLEPKVDGLKTEDGQEAKAFRLFAGSSYDDLETFDPDDQVWVTVVQRVPRDKSHFSDERLAEIDKFMAERNAKNGRETTVQATAAYRRAIEEGLVSYVVDEIDEYHEE